MQTPFTWYVRLKLRSRLFELASALVLVSASLPAYPQMLGGNVALPQAPQFPQGQDKIRGADGTECTRSTAPRKRFADIGFMGGNMAGTGGSFGYGGNSDGTYGQQGGAVYGRITFNLDAESPNLDCGRLYELELERLRIELDQARLMGTGKPVGTK